MPRSGHQWRTESPIASSRANGYTCSWAAAAKLSGTIAEGDMNLKKLPGSAGRLAKDITKHEAAKAKKKAQAAIK